MKCYLCIVVVAIVCLSYVQCFLSPSHTSFPISTVNIFSSTDQEAEISSLAPRFPRVEIEYCPGCRWLLRSAYLAQELLTTFESSLGSYLPKDILYYYVFISSFIGEVALIPQREISGTFIIRVNGIIVWDRTQEGTKGFPETKILKQLVRDIIDTNIDLGHSDKK